MEQIPLEPLSPIGIPAGISVVIPVLNAAPRLPATLAALRGNPVTEIVVADGGSSDASAEAARSVGARVVTAPRGRGPQLAAGIQAARQDWLLLLHADTRLGPGWREAAGRHMQASEAMAAYFRFALASGDRRARLLERLVAWRCRVLALPYGDQGLLIHRRLLTGIGGMRELPLMEDVDLVRRIGRRRLVGIDVPAVTSAERWERDGWLRRSARNLACLGLYQLGVPPRWIRRLYG